MSSRGPYDSPKRPTRRSQFSILTALRESGCFRMGWWGFFFWDRHARIAHRQQSRTRTNCKRGGQTLKATAQRPAEGDQEGGVQAAARGDQEAAASRPQPAGGDQEAPARGDQGPRARRSVRPKAAASRATIPGNECRPGSTRECRQRMCRHLQRAGGRADTIVPTSRMNHARRACRNSAKAGARTSRRRVARTKAVWPRNGGRAEARRSTGGRAGAREPQRRDKCCASRHRG